MKEFLGRNFKCLTFSDIKISYRKVMYLINLDHKDFIWFCDPIVQQKPEQPKISSISNVCGVLSDNR